MISQEKIDAYKAMSLTEKAVALRDLKADHADAKSSASALNGEIELLTKTLIPEEMDSMEVSSMNIKGVGRLGLRADAYCTVPAANKERLYEWLRDNDFEALISETVNSSTLKAFMKEQILEGNDVPDEIVNFSPYTMATITKT